MAFLSRPSFGIPVSSVRVRSFPVSPVGLRRLREYWRTVFAASPSPDCDVLEREAQVLPKSIARFPPIPRQSRPAPDRNYICRSTAPSKIAEFRRSSISTRTQVLAENRHSHGAVKFVIGIFGCQPSTRCLPAARGRAASRLSYGLNAINCSFHAHGGRFQRVALVDIECADAHAQFVQGLAVVFFQSWQ
jgi:hypothetical protein